MDGCEVTALVDLGAQVSNINAQLWEELGLDIQPLGELLELEWTGGAAIPYLGFVEVNLQILGIRAYNEDVLLLAISHHGLCWKSSSHGGLKNNRYSSELHDCMGELACATATWKQAHFGAVMSGSLQLSYNSSEKLKIGNLIWGEWPCGGVEVPVGLC